MFFSWVKLYKKTQTRSKKLSAQKNVSRKKNKRNEQGETGQTKTIRRKEQNAFFLFVCFGSALCRVWLCLFISCSSRTQAGSVYPFWPRRPPPLVPPGTVARQCWCRHRPATGSTSWGTRRRSWPSWRPRTSSWTCVSCLHGWWWCRWCKSVCRTQCCSCGGVGLDFFFSIFQLIISVLAQVQRKRKTRPRGGEKRKRMRESQSMRFVGAILSGHFFFVSRKMHSISIGWRG